MKMIELFFFVILSTLLISCTTSPYDDSSSSVVAEERLCGNIPFESVSVLKVYPKERNRTDIKGICFVITTPESFFDLPCKNIDFELFDSRGKTVGAAQTDDEGRFRFILRSTGRYSLRVKSNKYKTLSDEIIVSSGSDALVRLVKR